MPMTSIKIPPNSGKTVFGKLYTVYIIFICVCFKL